jgi:hypothetical protein
MTDPWSLTPAEAGEKLVSMSREFNSAEAHSGERPQPTLETLVADQRAATEQRDAAVILDHLIAAGLSPEISPAGAEVQQYINGTREITPELRAAVDAKVESWKRDPEFRRKLLSGDPEAARLLNIASAMRIAPLTKGKAAA